MWILLWCSLLGLAAGSLVPPEEDCFQAGECTDGFLLSFIPADDEFACLESCNEDARCGFFTYFPELEACQLLHNCTNLDDSFCSTCLSGPAGCDLPAPQCDIQGQCQGNLIFTRPVESKEDCLDLCKSTEGCNWFTFVDQAEQFCVLLHDCTSLDETCSDCVSGEKRCTTEDKNGYVALIVDNDGDAELYSPEGLCNYKLARTPVRQYDPALVFAKNRIIACGAEASCWEYNIKEDSWLSFTETTYGQRYQRGVVYKNKLYIIDLVQPQVLDLVSNTWSTWPKNPDYFEQGPCMIGWKDSLILIGGFTSSQTVQIFNVTTQSWSLQNSTDVPVEVYASSCLLIDEGEILISGSSSVVSHTHSVSKYYPLTDTWLRLEDSETSHIGSVLVKLGSRIFAVDGLQSDSVEEFNPADNTWSLIDVKPINSYDGSHSVVALPASLFADLPGGCKGVL